MSQIPQPQRDVSRVTPAPGSVRDLLQSTAVRQRFEQVMNNPNKASQFVASLAQLVYANPTLQSCTFQTIIASAIQAAALDLAIDSNLGQAFIIPYKNRDVYEAHFQIGWKGYIQLALRTGLYQMLNVNHALEGEVAKVDKFTGEITFGEATSDKPAGVVAYLKLVNGFQHFDYWTLDAIHKHAKRFSKSYGTTKSGWTTNPEAMEKKTVLLDLIRKYGVLSIEMRQAISAEKANYEADAEWVQDDNGNAPEGDKPPTAEQNAAADRAIVESEKVKA